ncbi:MAG: sulfotransferase family protein [Candidatus Binatia bacterium]
MSRVRELCDAARSTTGLEDFGGSTFLEGLEVLADSLAREAHLTEAGEQIARAHLVHLLATRLEVEDWRRRHPEIDAQQVHMPLFVLGLPRTGTTALTYLLARDPDTRPLRFWESQQPTPPPETATEESDPRIAATQAVLDAMHGAYPELVSMYFATAKSPTECQDLLGREFRAQHFCGSYWLPAYAEWQMGCDMEPAYRCHRRQLELLQWRCGPTRWLLKTPIHMLSLDALDHVYPDARFVMTHRDPARVLGSVCSLIALLYSMASERVDRVALGRAQLDLWAEALRRLIDFRARVGDGRFADLHFREIEEQPLEAIARAYAKLGIRFTDAARARMSGWAGENPKGKHGEHRYRLEEFGLEAATVRERFAFYTRHFDVPLEG